MTTIFMNAENSKTSESHKFVLSLLQCFQYNSDPPQVNGNLLFSITNLVMELPHNTQGIKNIRKMPNLGGEIAQCLLSLVETKLSLQQSKRRQNQISKFPVSAQFYWISLLCPNYFVREFLIRQIFDRSLVQSTLI